MKKNYTLNVVLMAVLFCLSAFGVVAQPSIGGTPPSFDDANASKSQVMTYQVEAPDVRTLLNEDAYIENNGYAPRAAVILPVDFNINENGQWDILPNGQKIWRLQIQAKGAKAVLLTYNKFYLPKGSRLYIYNKDKTQILGAYTSDNNPLFGPEFSTELLAGDVAILEYVAPFVIHNKGSGRIDPRTGKQMDDTQDIKPYYETPIIEISGIGYAYNDNISVTKIYDAAKTPSELGASGSCMVNINCAEGATWQNQKKGVAATLQKIGSSYYICSGSLINNLREDLTPYFLMAWHCSTDDAGKRSTAADYNQYQFYFHWERSGCSNTSAPVAYKTMTGCQLQTDIPLSSGSDGLLLRLNSVIPTNYDVYYNGWDASTATPSNGVSIHHPSGDVKKVSTYTTGVAPTMANIQGFGQGASNGHWGFKFVATTNGHGVVEGGSSGSPMFNSSGLIVGTLTGGNASCAAPNEPNLYGRMWYHFDQSPNPASRMKPYLDPDNTGTRVCQGRYASTEPIANFMVEKRKVYAMEPVKFYNQSFNATSYYWEFEGGTPATSTEKDPVVTYDKVGGPYKVALTINGGTASKIEQGYITSVEKELETEITIGTGTSVAANPLGYAVRNGRTLQAMLYKASELGSAGNLNSIAFYTNTATAQSRRIIIHIKHTDANDLSSLPENLTTWNTDGYTNVADISGITTTAREWQTFEFNKAPFQYNGTQNIIVMTEVIGPSDASVNPGVRYTAAASCNRFVSTTYSSTARTGGTTNNNRPNAMFMKSTPSVAPVADFKGNVKFDMNMKEGFDDVSTFPPTGWSITKKHAKNNWSTGKLSQNDFSTDVDPTSLGSAIVVYIAADQDEWLITPATRIVELGTRLQFWAFYGSYLAYAQLNCKISTEAGGYTDWVQVWTTGKTDVESVWRKIDLSLDNYVGKNIKVAWQYVGNDGNTMSIDNVVIGKEDPLGKYEMFTDELLTLTDLSSGPPVLWEWMNPGSETPVTQSLGEVPSVKYNYPGTYDLGLKVTNLRGTDTKYMAEQLVVKDRIVGSNFTVKSIGGYDVVGVYLDEYHPYIAPGGNVAFTDKSSNNPNAWKWELEGAAPATSSEQNVTATYNKEGSFGVKFHATNSQGGSKIEQKDLVKVGYSEEWLTNFNVENGAIGDYNVGTAYSPILLGGSGLANSLAEYYEMPASAGFITGVFAYVSAIGTGSRDYTIQLCKATPGGPGAVLYSWSFNINQLKTSGPKWFALDEPMAINESFFVVVNNFTTYNASTVLTILQTIGNTLPDDEYATGWVKSTANTGGAWLPASFLFANNPAISYALWPVFAYTKLEVSENVVTLPKTGAVKDLIISSNIAFTAATTDNWYTLQSIVDKTTVDGTEVITGGKVKITFQTNTGNSRNGSFTITGGGVTHTIDVLQLAGDALSLYASPASKEVSSDMGIETFSITGNVQWEVSCNDSWVTINNADGVGASTLVVNYLANKSVTPRTAEITVKGGGLTRTLQLIQNGAAPYLTVNPEGEVGIYELDGLRGVEIKSNVSWIANTGSSWLKLTSFAGTGDGYMYYEFQANPTTAERIATIEIQADNISKTITVKQAAGKGTFAVNPSNLLVNQAAGNSTVVLTADNNWTATVDIASSSWLSLNPTSGAKGSNNVSVVVTANTATTSRKGTITFSNGTLYRYLEVEQSGVQTLTVNKNSTNIGYLAGTETINVTSNATWIATSKADWMTVSNPYGTGAGSFGINYTKNMGTNRQGTVEITVPGTSLKQVVTINQDALPSYNVTLPASPVGYTITPTSGSTSPVLQGGSYAFRVTVATEYNQSTPIVKTNGTVLTAVGGIYTINNITANQTITVENVVINKYAVNWTASPDITVTVLNGSTPITNGAMVNHGSILTITANAPAGKQINVTVNGSTFANGGTYTVAGAVSIVASSTTIQHSITWANPTGATIEVKNGANAITSGTRVDYGTVITITANVNASHNLTSLKVNGVDFVSGNTYTVTGDVTIAATTAIKTYTITVVQANNGTISPSGVVTVNYNANQTFTINANEDYSVDYLIIDGVNVSASGSYTFSNVVANHTISAVFKYTPGMMSITLPSVEGAIVAAVPGYSSPVEYGADFKFTVNLNAGYTQSTPLVVSNGNEILPVNGIYTIRNITTHQVVTVSNIVKNTYMVTLPSVQGATVAIAAGYSPLVKYGDNFCFTVTLDNAYSNSNYVVKANGVQIYLVDGKYTIENISENQQVTITGVEKNRYYITLPIVEGATISALSGIYNPTHKAYEVVYGDNFSFSVTLLPSYSNSNYIVRANSEQLYLVDGKFTIGNITQNQEVVVGGIMLNRYYVVLPSVVGATVTAIDGEYNPYAEAYEVDYGQNFKFSVVLDEAYNHSQYVVKANQTQLFPQSGTLTNAVYGIMRITDDNNVTISSVVKNSYTINVVQAANGTISPSTSIVEYGNSQKFTITPNNGYYIKDVKVDGVSVSALAEYTFSNVVENHTITAEFGVKTYTLTVVQTEGGAISPITGVINHGESRTFTITPEKSCKLVDVKVDGVSVGAVTSYTFNSVDANHTITALFAVKTYTITVTQGANGVISPETCVVNYGESRKFTITPNADYHTVGVVVNGTTLGAVNEYTFGNITADQSISAVFAINTYTIVAVAGNGGTISPMGTMVLSAGDNQSFTMTPNEGYQVKEVLIDGVSVGNVTAYTFENVKDNHIITVSFEKANGVNEQADLTSKVYSSGMTIYVKLSEVINAEVDIIDVTGRVVSRLSTDNGELATTMTTQGTYVVRVISNDKVVGVEKVIVK